MSNVKPASEVPTPSVPPSSPLERLAGYSKQINIALLVLAAAFAAIPIILAVRRDLFALSRQPPLNAFLNREAGIHILWELMLSQAPERPRLLTDAPISRNALSHRYDVSRAHINKLLADSGHAQADGDRVYFSEALSDRLERHMALVLRLNEVVGACLLSGWRADPPDQAQAAAG